MDGRIFPLQQKNPDKQVLEVCLRPGCLEDKTYAIRFKPAAADLDLIIVSVRG